jgi:Chitobiase/beta-hexosaminidase C-terminal domain
MKRLKLLLIALLALGLPALGQVFTCSSFVTTNTSCGVGGLISGSGSAFKVVGTTNGVTPALTSGNVIIAPSGGTHFALSMMYQTAVNVAAFTTVFNFVPNGQNIAFTINNCANNGSSGYGTCGGFNLANFSAGASCEGGFSQAFSGNPFPYNIFALMFDNYGLLTPGGSGFTYSSAQIYQQNQSPCNPSSGGSFSAYTNKLSTSPVALNNPATTQGAASTDIYAATLNYDGSNLNLCLIDATAGTGTCNSTGTGGTGTFYQNTWQNVSIPSQVDGTTGYIGIVGSSGLASAGNLEVTGWTYTVNTATASPGSTVTSAGAPTATNPSFSPAAGSYSGTQNVTISSSGSSNICYALGSSGLVKTPIANQNGGCGAGTLYTGPVSVSSSQTLYAVAGLNGTGTSSGVVQGAYTIGGGSASQPTFSPAAGTYTGSQNVTLSTSSGGAVICYSTTTTPATNGSTGCTTGTLYSSPITVSSSETLKAIAGGTGYTDSSVGSAAYTLVGATPTFSPAAGTYTGAQSVAISATFGLVICYNTTGSPATNGSTGCTTGTLYSGPVSVSTSETLYAVAGGTGYSDSSVGSAGYVVSSSPTAVIGGKIVITGKTVLQ